MRWALVVAWIGALSSGCGDEFRGPEGGSSTGGSSNVGGSGSGSGAGGASNSGPGSPSATSSTSAAGATGGATTSGAGTTTASGGAMSTCNGGAPNAICEVKPDEPCDCADCQSTAKCVPDQCVHNDTCTAKDACICKDCWYDPQCFMECASDDVCDSYLEGCHCSECKDKPQCLGYGQPACAGVPAVPPSNGACVKVGGATVACNPVTNAGCSAGAACDFGEMKFQCFEDENVQPICGACGPGSYCKAGMVCFKSTCTKYCCEHADCGPNGLCVVLDFGIAEAPVGICLAKP